MSSLARTKHPKMILGAVGTAIAIPVLGITISFVSVSANTQQKSGVQQDASAQEEAIGAVANVSTPPRHTSSPTEMIAAHRAPGKVNEVNMANAHQPVWRGRVGMDPADDRHGQQAVVDAVVATVKVNARSGSSTTRSLRAVIPREAQAVACNEGASLPPCSSTTVASGASS